MAEPFPCSKCGGVHAPGVCDTKEKSPEQMQFESELKNNLMNSYGFEGIEQAKQTLANAEASGIQIDVQPICQNVFDELARSYSFYQLERVVDFAESRAIKLNFLKPENITAFNSGLQDALKGEEDIYRVKIILNLSDTNSIPLGNLSDLFKDALRFRFFENGISKSTILYIELAESRGVSLDFSDPEIISDIQNGLKECVENGRVESAKSTIDFANIRGIPTNMSSSYFQVGLQRQISGWSGGSDPQYTINLARDNKVEIDIALACRESLKIRFKERKGWCSAEALDGIFNFWHIHNVKVEPQFLIECADILTQQKKFFDFYRFCAYFPELAKYYSEFVQKQKSISYDINADVKQRAWAKKALIGLTNYDTELRKEFVGIIKSKRHQTEVSVTKMGLDTEQETALFAILGINVNVMHDNPDSSKLTLLNLLMDNKMPLHVKASVLRILSESDNRFLTGKNRLWIKNWMQSAPLEQLDWQDLKFVTAANDISSKSLSEKALSSAVNVMNTFSQSKQGLNKTWETNYKDVPEHTFAQLWIFTKGDIELMGKFQILYSTIRKENSLKENLLFSITTILEINPALLVLTIEKLKVLNFSSKEDAQELSLLLRNIFLLDSLDKTINKDNRLEQSDGVSEDIVEVFTEKTNNLTELKKLLKDLADKRVQKVLPHKEMTSEKLDQVTDSWGGNTEPIFTYLSRFPDLNKYIAEIVVHCYSEENWKSWRYDVDNAVVKEQIGHMSEEQRGVWKNGYAIELGDVMMSQSDPDKPRHVRNLLQGAVVTDKHIFNPEMGKTENEMIQKILSEVFGRIEQSPDDIRQITEDEVVHITGSMKQIDSVIKNNDLPKLNDILTNTFPIDGVVNFNSKSKSAVNFLASFLPKEMKQQLADNYKTVTEKYDLAVKDKTAKEIEEIRKDKKFFGDKIITSEIRQMLEAKMIEIEYAAKNTIEQSDIWEKFGLDKTHTDKLAPFFQKIQELKAVVDLLRLCNLSSKLIATNRIVEGESKEGGEKLLTVLENLKKFFKDSPLLQDLENVEFALKEKQDLGGKRRLAMFFTDDPQMLWQVGKYPLGCGSCQNYEAGSHAGQLMGYVGDANCKVAYLVDLNQLPYNLADELSAGGFDSIKDKIPKQQLLDCSMARVIMKITADTAGAPVVLLEPTYSRVNKADASMDGYFQIFANLVLAEPMKVRMAKHGGTENLTRGRSRSPGGQYEDTRLDQVQFIDISKQATEKEQKVAEMIRMSI